MLNLTATQLSLEGRHLVVKPRGDLWDSVRIGLAYPGGTIVLGPFGSGKTHLVQRLAEEGLGTPIPLRLLHPDRPIESELVAAIGRQRLDQARSGALPLLLDGFDEARFAPEQFQERFEELTENIGPRWMLTSRPGHFRTEEEAAPDQVDSLDAGFATLLIDPLCKATVHEALANVGGSALVDSVDGLADLATSPMLLRVVEAALPFIEPGRKIQAWGLFDAWIRHALSTGPEHAAVLDRLVDLTWAVSRRNAHAPTAMRFGSDELAALELPWALRSALIVTDLDGQLRFGHRSVFEFLLAGHLAPRIAANQGEGPDALSGMRLTDATRAFLVGRVPLLRTIFDGNRVLIPRGNFVAGGDRALDERPLRIQHLEKPFGIARAPVTNAEWASYLERNPDPREDIHYLSHWGRERRCPPGREDEPVHNIWPEDADQYAQEQGARLPTADEWEKAVRGTDGRRWPWGDHWRTGRAVTAETGVKRPLPVRAFGAHGVTALYSAVGGVFEYTSTSWRGRADRGRIVMGGCYTHPSAISRAGLRLSHKLSGNLKAGLRLAWSIDD